MIYNKHILEHLYELFENQGPFMYKQGTILVMSQKFAISDVTEELEKYLKVGFIKLATFEDIEANVQILRDFVMKEDIFAEPELFLMLRTPEELMWHVKSAKEKKT